MEGGIKMYIYSEQEIRFADQKAEQAGLEVFTLMENAGHALFNEIVPHVSKLDRILILAGKGNNGGDGIVLARYLKQNGYLADLTFPLGEPASLIAKHHLKVFKSFGYSIAAATEKYDVIVDALLGVGTRLPLRQEVISIVDWANTQDAYRIAIDLPTGVTADCGSTSVGFRADLTISLHGWKPSAFLHPANHFYGNLRTVNIGLPHEGRWKIWTEEDVKKTYPTRPLNSNKGTFGTGLLVAGCDEMPGSAMLSGIGAMRSGIGKLVIATTPFASSIICTRLPESTFLHNGLEKIASGVLPEKIKAIAIGPGLSDSFLIEKAIEHLLRAEIPLVIDASALSPRFYPKRTAPIILTPHPGEFSKMTGKSIQQIQENRLQLASEYAKEHHVIVVLKGVNTVIAFPDGSGFINRTGNSALAKGGTGDTLTGMILAMLCTHEHIEAAVANAVYLHGKCSDIWCGNFLEDSLLASDFDQLLPQVIKTVFPANL